MSGQYIIKKYNNRKYYDSHQHKYLLIGQIWDMFVSLKDSPSPLKIVDAQNRDVTTNALTEGIKHCMYQDPWLVPGILDCVLEQLQGYTGIQKGAV